MQIERAGWLVGRLRGFLWLVAGLVVAGLAGIVAFITLSRVAAQGTGEVKSAPGVTVVVAARAVPLRLALTSGDLEVREVPVDVVPEGAISDREEAEGKVTLVDLSPGEIILGQRLLDPNVTPADGRLALFVAEDEVLMAFPPSDLLTQVGVLKPGDRVDLLMSLYFPPDRGMEALTGGDDEGGSDNVRRNRERLSSSKMWV